MVSISPEGSPEITGLGLISGQYIFTCAHYTKSLPLGLADTCLFMVRRVSDNVCGRFAMYLGTTMDFMVLGLNGIHCELEDGPTSDSWPVLDIGEPETESIRPATIDFGDKTSGRLPGFCFAPDGKTIYRVDLKVIRDRPEIVFTSKEAGKGCSGGPIFTEDFHLIGIYVASYTATDGPIVNEKIGKRIDMCCPVFLQRQLDWDNVTVC